MSQTAEERSSWPSTTCRKPWIGFENSAPTHGMDVHRQGHGLDPSLPDINTSETFTVHWAQLPPPPTTSKTTLQATQDPSLIHTSSTPSSISLETIWPSSSRDLSTKSTQDADASAEVGRSDTVDPSNSISSMSSTHVMSSAESRSSSLASTSSTSDMNPSIAVNDSSNDSPLSEGVTAAIVVSSFLAFSLCGFLAWLRWQHIKKRRAAEADLDFSTLHPHQQDAVPMSDVTTQSTLRPLTLSRSIPLSTGKARARHIIMGLRSGATKGRVCEAMGSELVTQRLPSCRGDVSW